MQLEMFQQAAEAEGMSFDQWMISKGLKKDPYGRWVDDFGNVVWEPPSGTAGGSSAADLALARERLALDRQRLQMDAISKQLEEAVAIGMFEDSQALERLDMELNSLLEGQRLQVAASEYAIAPGAEYLPGFGPGGIASQVAAQAGLAPGSAEVAAQPVVVQPGAALERVTSAPTPTPLLERPEIAEAFGALQEHGLPGR